MVQYRQVKGLRPTEGGEHGGTKMKYYAMAESNQGNIFTFNTKAAREEATTNHRVHAISAQVARKLEAANMATISAWDVNARLVGTEKRR